MPPRCPHQTSGRLPRSRPRVTTAPSIASVSPQKALRLSCADTGDAGEGQSILHAPDMNNPHRSPPPSPMPPDGVVTIATAPSNVSVLPQTTNEQAVHIIFIYDHCQIIVVMEFSLRPSLKIQFSGILNGFQKTKHVSYPPTHPTRSFEVSSLYLNTVSLGSCIYDGTLSRAFFVTGRK